MAIETPLKRLLYSQLKINSNKPSAHIIKRYGESGSPCLMPLSDTKFPYTSLFIRKEYDIDVTYLKTHYNNLTIR